MCDPLERPRADARSLSGGNQEMGESACRGKTNRWHRRRRGIGPVCKAKAYWEWRRKRPKLVSTQRSRVSGARAMTAGPADGLGG